MDDLEQLKELEVYDAEVHDVTASVGGSSSGWYKPKKLSTNEASVYEGGSEIERLPKKQKTTRFNMQRMQDESAQRL